MQIFLLIVNLKLLFLFYSVIIFVKAVTDAVPCFNAIIQI